MLASGRTPNFVLNASLHLSSTGRDPIILPEGAFARPIQLEYVPKHVIEDVRWRYFNSKAEIFCYTRFGIVPIPRNYLREV